MIVAALILSCIIWTALKPPADRRTTPSDTTPQRRLSRKRGTHAADEEPADPAPEERPTWTALDDRQIERLLRDSAP
jgi:hypothetical protein